MSTILVDNLTGKTSAGSITVTSEGGAATQSLQQGLAKHWVRFIGSGTAAILDSLSASSLTDNGTGDYDINYTNSMNNNTYAVPAGCNGDGSGYNRAISINAVATGSHDIITFITDTANIKADLDIITTAVFGDLA